MALNLIPTKGNPNSKNNKGEIHSYLKKLFNNKVHPFDLKNNKFVTFNHLTHTCDSTGYLLEKGMDAKNIEGMNPETETMSFSLSDGKNSEFINFIIDENDSVSIFSKGPEGRIRHDIDDIYHEEKSELSDPQDIYNNTKNLVLKKLIIKTHPDNKNFEKVNDGNAKKNNNSSILGSHLMMFNISNNSNNKDSDDEMSPEPVSTTPYL